MKEKKLTEITWQKDVKKLLQRGVEEGIFPCAATGISCGLGKERNTIIAYYGDAVLYPEKRKIKKNSYFDLASLTKPLATTLATLCLIKEKKIGLDEKLPSLIEKKIKGEKKEITASQLLSHSSGFPAHREYFKILRDVPDKKKNESIEKMLLQEKLEYKPGTMSLYSDLGFMLLGLIVEKKGRCSLAEFVEKKVLTPLNLEKKIFYNPLPAANKRGRKTDFVATENCPWRGKILCGEVHDDNCYAMGGIAGHSGLFGNIEGVTAYAGLILDMWKGKKIHPNIENSDLKTFLRKQGKIKDSSWALGFDTPAKGGSSSGRYLSKRSVGHLGFTGTSFWIDPEKELVIVLLTNRVHPDRENAKIRAFRPYFHDTIVGKFLKQS